MLYRRKRWREAHDADSSRGRKTGGRRKDARNRATAEARAAAKATGIMPLDYMLLVMQMPIISAVMQWRRQRRLTCIRN